jgi:enoyl-CoA hydratase/carnithine racemase
MGATHFLPKLTNHETALYLLTTGDVISGTAAKNLGLCAHVAPDAHATVEHALGIAQKISNQGPMAVRQVVETLRGKEDPTALQQDLHRESECQAENFGSDEMEEGLSAVRKKRKPDFAKKDGGPGSKL